MGFIKINRKLSIYSIIVTVLSPIIALAQASPPGEFQGTPLNVVESVLTVAGQIFWQISIAVVIIMFSIAGFKFLTAQGDPSKISEARNAVIWGTVGVTVVVLAWSMIAIMRAQFGV